MTLQGKKIILGITASIAAYKSIQLVRLLTKAGAEVRIVMTKDAKEFVSPLVLSTFSHHPVWIEFHEGNVWNNHVELGLWGDVFIVAPATCNTLSKMANGLCDNIVLATYLSARCPVIVAPAMDEDMFLHPATQRSLELLRSYGNTVLAVNSGELASGLVGQGRMMEPEEIVQYLIQTTFRDTILSGKHVLITAGPTQELLDPVRYISNFSTGKMGICLAEECYLQGAEVTLIAGPLQVSTHIQGINVVNVRSAAEMELACLVQAASSDIIFMAAAVADYRPASPAKEKIKKSEAMSTLVLEKTTDILSALGAVKKAHQTLVGFALETENEEANALKKMQQKNTDFIVLNSLKEAGAGFGLDTNQVTIFSASGEKKKVELQSKVEVAKEIIEFVIAH
ncbi:bifunctional phosphopantothenoylcysteine decarboxylase/phosphopantothenate--cysteine ligase CoaBC [Aquirufa antheringensis]|jgi:phosphopantothenoylcysteine decarboxylase/phosphopantothenate--cysteine ligase|uniref:Coenzyme A biosynthesis bifunctional protein CoaBC n=1 Tax=Aquirufa antheringensis TaxID=2516559 RepID=A0A4Q9BG11_9BACT|nr:bifunctional phosphopantothenoylcysteine decarboxylase/phosphopantothenate--cysteine ligase CoaBC [Aquirufa antheringensis]MCE4217438.1 bifunctional phosphopantothenoylcysteine decarboxylase/phosphopantothenate--cysteine ligase CoaBC [Pseudarcicella sp. GAP-15]MCZ2484891.1 bifunctional phosphopantothenoylcysteine decarboxylase/phosphopantothenate--cysteine ligase CoaBC [Aquirufa antheringensis]MCZ2487094.1 bifunctional phosphopantothenoylcysteine decarboxylase/phosphopantothenate--cysteine li